MQRLFIMFPNGVPGLALFVLRFSVGATLLIGVGAINDISSGSPRIVALLILFSLLCAGLFTPIAALINCIICLISQLEPGPQQCLMMMNIFYSITLAMIGPGAYSLDSHFYGRRVVQIGKARDLENH